MIITEICVPDFYRDCKVVKDRGDVVEKSGKLNAIGGDSTVVP